MRRASSWVWHVPERRNFSVYFCIYKTSITIARTLDGDRVNVILFSSQTLKLSGLVMLFTILSFLQAEENGEPWENLDRKWFKDTFLNDTM